MFLPSFKNAGDPFPNRSSWAESSPPTVHRSPISYPVTYPYDDEQPSSVASDAASDLDSKISRFLS